MSLKRNIIANYVSQIYMSLAGILILPLYLKYMGAEAYGLVGFFAMLQVWFNILDMGLTPTIAKQTASMHGGALTPLQYRSLLRALQVLFILIMIVGASVLLALSPYLSHSWLKVQTLSIQQVQTALQLMAIAVTLRWLSSLYRAVLTGSEQFVWLSACNLLFTTFRYLGVLFVLIFISPTPRIFFSYQVIVSSLELLIMAHKTRSGFPTLANNQKLSWLVTDLTASIKPILPFALSIAATSSIWVLVTQTDKLILSKLLSLSEFGYFTLGILAASSIMMMSTSISTALMPRLAKLKAENNQDSLLKVYAQATQLVAALVLPAGLILSLFPEQILWIWTKNMDAAQQAAPVLRLYALGNAALALTAFPYYLQYAYGTMKLHLMGNVVFVLILLPTIIWATHQYGMMGAGYVWLLANLGFFFIWTSIVHNYFVPHFHLRWLLQNVVPLVVSSSLIIYALKSLMTESQNMLSLTFQIGVILIATMGFNVLLIRSAKQFYAQVFRIRAYDR